MLIENNCNASALLSLLGGKSCDLGIITGFHLLDRSVKINPNLFDKEALDKLVKSGKSLGFLDFYEASDNNADPTYAESVQNKRVQKIRGRKGWILTFDKGTCFDNELDKLNNSKNWAVIPVFEDGKAVFKKNSDGTIKGFDCRLFHSTYNLSLTGDVTGSVLEIDIDETVEWQRNKGLFTPDDFDFTELEPVAGAGIEIAEPLVAGSEVKASVSYLCSNEEIVGIEDLAHWNAIVNGIGVTISSIVSDDNGAYTFTLAIPLVASDKVVLELNDGTDKIVVIDTLYFTGKSTEVAVA